MPFLVRYSTGTLTDTAGFLYTNVTVLGVATPDADTLTCCAREPISAYPAGTRESSAYTVLSPCEQETTVEERKALLSST